MAKLVPTLPIVVEWGFVICELLFNNCPRRIGEKKGDFCIEWQKSAIFASFHRKKVYYLQKYSFFSQNIVDTCVSQKK